MSYPAFLMEEIQHDFSADVIQARTSFSGNLRIGHKTMFSSKPHKHGKESSEQ